VPDIDLGELFRDLRRNVVPVPFAEIVARRRRRTRETLGRTAAVVVVLVAVGVVSVIGHRGGGAPLGSKAVNGASFGPYQDGQDITSVAADSVDFVGANAIVALVDTCGMACDGSSGHAASVYRTDDLGAHWTQVGGVPDLSGQETMLVGGGKELWIQDGALTYASVDGGRTWSRSEWSDPDEGGGSRPIGYADGVAWFDIYGHVASARSGKGIGAAGDPPGVSTIVVFVAMNADRAMLGGRTVGGLPLWYVTTDGGKRWLKSVGPCEQGMGTDGMAKATDGSLWAVCDTSPDLVLLRVSEDHGGSWRTLSKANGDNDELFPVSAKVAWLTSQDGVVYRTVNGVTWSSVAKADTYGRPAAFAAYSGDVAVYAYGVAAGVPTVFVTTDGGRTWIGRPIR
jgi:photosystem II stability/assembly factor-like uncharacterized protein